jgi:acetylglutamate kinase
MKNITMYVSGKELDDVLIFNRLRADVRKIVQTHQLILVHDAEYQFQQALARRGNAAQATALLDTLSLKLETLTTLNKTFAAKLSEDLVPALPIAAHHLGLVREVEREGEKTLIVKTETLLEVLSRNVLPVVAPIVQSADRQLVDAAGDKVAAKLAAAVHADVVIFLSEQKTPQPNLRDTAAQSLVEGAKRAFITDLNGMEKILLRAEHAETEIFV